MPPAFWDDVSDSGTKDKSRQMDVAQRKLRADPVIFPTDGDAVAPKRRTPQKHSLDYVWRSGLAGGLAGCAVCKIVLQALVKDRKLTLCVNRPKASWLLLIESRFSSKPAILNLQSIQDHGSESRLR